MGSTRWTILRGIMKVHLAFLLLHFSHSFLMLPYSPLTYICPTFPHCSLQTSSGHWIPSSMTPKPSELVFRETQDNSCWYEEGYCEVTRKNTVSTETVQTAEDCSKICTEKTECKYFTFLHHRGRPTCSLITHCDTFIPQCPSTQGCVSGPKLCSCPAIERFKTDDDDSKEYARWECGDLNPYTSSVPVGTVCSVSCPIWKEVTFQSKCMRGGTWTPSTPSTHTVSLGYSTTTVVNSPDQEDMECGCVEVGPFKYDPNDEIGAEMVCRGGTRNKDFKAAGGWSLTTSDHCDLWCSHVLVVSVFCEDSQWVGKPEKGFWCYQRPEKAEPGCSIERGVEYDEDNIAGKTKISVSSHKDCAKLCFEESRCNYWSYSQDLCWLKTAKNNVQNNRAYISGQKACGKGEGGK